MADHNDVEAPAQVLPRNKRSNTAFQRFPKIIIAIFCIAQVVRICFGTIGFPKSSSTNSQIFIPLTQPAPWQDSPSLNQKLVKLLEQLPLPVSQPDYRLGPAHRRTRPRGQNRNERLECSMSNCFSLKRCKGGFKIYIYPDDPQMKIPVGKNKLLWESYNTLKKVIKDHFTVVTDPQEACILVPPYETSCEANICSFDHDKLEEALPSLPHWGNNGQNHLILNYGNEYPWPEFHTGKAMVLSSSMTRASYRSGFDVMLPIVNFLPWLENNRANTSRDLLLYFQGAIYNVPECMARGRHLNLLAPAAEANKDVVLLGLCSLSGKTSTNVSDPDFPAVCDSCIGNSGRCVNWKRSMPIIDYRQGLSRAKFGWAPRGCGPLTYRLIETIFSGGIPVQTGGDAVLPFGGDDTDISRAWRQCVIFPTESSLPFLVDGLRNMTEREYTRRLQACKAIINSEQNDLYHVLWLGICSVASRVKRSVIDLDISHECGQVLKHFSNNEPVQQQ